MAGIHTAILNIKREIGVVEKDGYNKTQGFEFRSIDGIYNRAHGLFARHGVITLPSVVTVERSSWTTAKGGTMFSTRLVVEYSLIAEDGSGLVCKVAGEGMDSGDKATSKAMAMAHKYMFIQVLQLQTAEDDADAISPDNRAPYRLPDAADNAQRERQRDAQPPAQPARMETAGASWKDNGTGRSGLGDRILALVKGDKDKAKKTLAWLVGRDGLSQLSDFETRLGHMAVDVIVKCGGDPAAAKRWVNETWALPWFDKMTEGEFRQAEKHMAAGGLDQGRVEVAEDDIPF